MAERRFLTRWNVVLLLRKTPLAKDRSCCFSSRICPEAGMAARSLWKRIVKLTGSIVSGCFSREERRNFAGR